MSEDASPAAGPDAPRPDEQSAGRPTWEAPWLRLDGIGGGAQAAWAGRVPSVTTEARRPVETQAVTVEEAPAERGGVYEEDAPAPWFQGAQAAWAGEAPPPGIHLSFALEAPAAEGAGSVDLRHAPPTGLSAGRLQAGVLVTLARPDSSRSEPYTVRPNYVIGNTRVPLDPGVRASDDGAESLKTAGEPVPELALGHHIPATWWGGYSRLDHEEDPIHAIIPASLPGSHVRLGWGNGSLTIGGMGYGT
jgi:hypothetical protein